LKDKVLFVLPSLSMGGLQKSGLVTVRALQKVGFDVDLCLLYSGSHFFSEVGNLVVYSPANQSKNVIIKWVQVWWHVLRSVNQSKANKVIVFGRYYGATTALALLFNRKIQLWISERNSPQFRMSAAYERFCDVLFMLRAPYGVLAQTKYAAIFQKGRYPNSKVVVFPNVFESERDSDNVVIDSFQLEDYTVGKDGQNGEEGAIVFLVAGRFNDALKGIPDVLEAFLRTDNGKVKLLIAGGSLGEDKAVDAVIERYRDSSTDIVFLGKVEDMSLVYSRADIFILPSNSEGFPNALVEAMQRGLCCITAEFHPGVFEIIDGETNGIVVPSGNVMALESVINKVLAGKVDIVALGKNAAETAKKFEIEHRLAEIKEVFGVS
jgi:glycosyltransferase involved in cell wall biosynthesis